MLLSIFLKKRLYNTLQKKQTFQYTLLKNLKKNIYILLKTEILAHFMRRSKKFKFSKDRTSSTLYRKL